MLSSYGKLSSEVYDIDKPIGGSYRDVAYYMTRLETCNGTILEPAARTGRMLIPLLEKGLTVEGFDSSEDMLNICKKNCKERHLNPKLFEAKMESFSLDKKYDAIILPTGTFLLLYKRADSIKALQNFYKHLSPGGRLIVDISLQTDFQIGIVSTRTWNSSHDDIITLEEKLVEVNYINSILFHMDVMKSGIMVRLFKLSWSIYRCDGTAWKSLDEYLEVLDLEILLSLQIVNSRTTPRS